MFSLAYLQSSFLTPPDKERNALRMPLEDSRISKPSTTHCSLGELSS